MNAELAEFSAYRYRSLRDVQLKLGRLNVFIGANASGKSNILDALRFLATAVREKDFIVALRERGGPLALAWKGEPASEIRLQTSFRAGAASFEWSVVIETPGYGWDFTVDESVTMVTERDLPPQELLQSRAGKGWWWSADAKRKVMLAQGSSECALAAAAADASFPAREIAEFVLGWGFFDPTPSLLRRTARDEEDRLDPFGRNLAARLRAINETSPQAFQQIVAATQNILGVPESIELRESEDGRSFFVQHESGLQYPVNQLGVSSGTLRMLALMTGLVGDTSSTLLGIEEPENYVHPAALQAFSEYLREASERLQILVTTHSPLVLNHLADPGSVVVVRRTKLGTEVLPELEPAAVAKALEESGMALGEFHVTKGFGA